MELNNVVYLRDGNSFITRNREVFPNFQFNTQSRKTEVFYLEDEGWFEIYIQDYILDDVDAIQWMEYCLPCCKVGIGKLPAPMKRWEKIGQHSRTGGQHGLLQNNK